MRRMTAAVTILAAAALSACVTLTEDHGFVPTEAELARVRVGLDTQTTVATLVGPPGVTGIVSDRGWYYVKSDFETFAYRAPVEVDREVVAISFDPRGVVSNVERFGLERGRVVALNRRVTDSDVQGITFLQQLFRNLGNFDPGTFIDG